MNRYLRRLLKRSKAVWHKVDWFLWLITLGLVYYLYSHGDTPYVDIVKVALAIIFVLAVGLMLLGHLIRRRLSNGFVGSGLEAQLLSIEFKECEGTYLFVGRSFKPHLETFLRMYRPDSFGKKIVSLVLAPCGNDSELGMEHLEVIEALRTFRVEFRTLKREQSWWTHVFNNENENKVSILVGLDVRDRTNAAIVLRFEKMRNRYGFFDHFLSEAREIYSFSNTKPVAIWSKELRNLVNPESSR